jgi:GNAT superfamily N-acetyltransferase
VAPLASAERESAALLLARAFRDNPLNQGVIGSSAARRLRCNTVGMRLNLEAVTGIDLVLAARPAAAPGGPLQPVSRGRSAGLVGVLVAQPPDRRPLPRTGLGAAGRLLLGQGPRVVGRWAQVSDRLWQLRPLGPHWLLANLGVDPQHWREGVGRGLLLDLLRRVDARPSRAYLETDRPEGRRLYESVGFTVRETIAVLGVPIHLMERPPQAKGIRQT